MLPDSIFMPSQTGEAHLRERGSRFLAYAFLVRTEEEAKANLNKLKKEHPSAVHWCWAMVMGIDANFQKSSDDREPSGSAGKPILNAILKHKLTFVQVVVVRYFGGKLLGVPGLIKAYGDSAIEALTKAGSSQHFIKIPLFVQCSFAKQHQVITLARQAGAKAYPDILNQLEGVTAEIAPSKSNFLQMQLKDAGFLTIIEKEIKLNSL